MGVNPFRFHREADAEFTDALDHYAGFGADPGGRCYDELERVRFALADFWINLPA